MNSVSIGPAPRSVLVDLLEKIRSNALVVGGLIIGGSVLDDWKGRLLLLALGGSVLAWLIGALDRLFTQRLEVSELGISYTSGLVERTRRELTWGEIASLHSVNSPASTLLGLITLAVVPAGSSEDSIIRLPGVRRGDANVVASLMPTSPEVSAFTEARDKPSSHAIVRVTVGPWDCVRMALASTGVIVAVPYILGLLQTATTTFGLQVQPGGHGLIGWLIASLATVLLALVVAIARRVYAYLGWTLEVDDESVAVTTGDFNTRRLNLSAPDVLVVTVRQPLTLRRREEVRVAVFGPASSELGSPPVLCPRLPATHLSAVLRACGFPFSEQEFTNATCSLRRTADGKSAVWAIALFALWCALPATFLAFRPTIDRGAFLFVAATAIAAVAATAVARWSATKVIPTADPDVILVASGALSRRVHIARRSDAFAVATNHLNHLTLLTLRYQANGAKALRYFTSSGSAQREIAWHINRCHRSTVAHAGSGSGPSPSPDPPPGCPG